MPILILNLKFNVNKALEWYNLKDYKSIKEIRLANYEGSNIIVRGI